MAFLTILLVSLAISSAESDCWSYTSSLIAQKLTLEQYMSHLEEWKSYCQSEIAGDMEVAENKDLQTLYQTALVGTDLALIYYTQNDPASRYFYSWAKTARNFFVWLEMVKILDSDSPLQCLTANTKVFADLWGWYEGTFSNAAVILLDFQTLRVHCPNSPFFYLTEFINRYLIPPTTPEPVEESFKDQSLTIEPRYGICAMRASFAYLSWAMTQNAKSGLSTMILFLNYANTISKLQSANANCEFIFN